LDVDKFKEYIRVHHLVAEKVNVVYSNLAFRKMNYSSFILGKKSIENFINKVRDAYGTNPVLLYGNWGRSDQMRGSGSTMGIGLKKALAQSFELYEIDECGTSKHCSYCDKELKYEKSNGKDKLYRVLKCFGCKSHKGQVNIRYIHRDINGALNILKLGLLDIQGLDRPEAYKRRKEVVKIKVATPKRIQESEADCHGTIGLI
jgi:hypothetical protein